MVARAAGAAAGMETVRAGALTVAATTLTAAARGQRLRKWAGGRRLLNPVHGGSGGTSAGDPVDVVTGRVFTLPTLDLGLPGPLPLVVQRRYSSSARERDMGLGFRVDPLARLGNRALQARRADHAGRRHRGDGPAAGRGRGAPAGGADRAAPRGLGIRAHDRGRAHAVVQRAPSAGIALPPHRAPRPQRGTASSWATTSPASPGSAIAFSASCASGGSARVESPPSRCARPRAPPAGTPSSLTGMTIAGILSRLWTPRDMCAGTPMTRSTAWSPTHTRSGLVVHYRYDREGRCIETWGEYPAHEDPSLAAGVPAFLADGVTRARGIFHCKLEFSGDGYSEVADSLRVRRFFGNEHGKVDKSTWGAGVLLHEYDAPGTSSLFGTPWAR